jgi:hypothetical protein
MMDTPNKMDMVVLSSLEKVFPDETPKVKPECTVFTALRNETLSFQVAYSGVGAPRSFARVELRSPLRDRIRLRTVELSPSSYPCLEQQDDNYLRTAPGMYPDLLRDLRNDKVLIVPGQWRSIWIDVDTGNGGLAAASPTGTAPAAGATDVACPAGVFPIALVLRGEDGQELGSCGTTVEIIDAALPAQDLIYTRWFHADCLADYYKVPVDSEAWWTAVEHFVGTAVRRGINMILTPTFTPPLDTQVGGERTTVQLVDVAVEKGAYRFGFDKLKRWVDLCKAQGVEYFEMAHLFTQWGARCAPKVMATVDGEYKRIFGWDSPAVGTYTEFLRAYLPQLIAKLKEWSIADRTWFHISDEPNLENLEYYKAARDSVISLLDGFTVFDALSNYDFYEKGIVAKPVPATNHMEPFLEHRVPGLWTYYCVGQWNKVSNQFFSMPSARNRIIATQLYKFKIEGFLHWGYNFYNSAYSLWHVDPYAVTDSGSMFPSGDPFMVYPGEGGVPEESIRLMVFHHALCDLRAMKYLEELAGRDFVMALLEGELAAPITFSEYPKSDSYLLGLRNRINREIGKRVGVGAKR